MLSPAETDLVDFLSAQAYCERFLDENANSFFEKSEGLRALIKFTQTPKNLTCHPL